MHKKKQSKAGKKLHSFDEIYYNKQETVQTAYSYFENATSNLKKSMEI